jgi:hypothetical protein
MKIKFLVIAGGFLFTTSAATFALSSLSIPAAMKIADPFSGPVLRRVKQITGNDRGVQTTPNDYASFFEAADPTRPMPFISSQGKRGWRWDASGRDSFFANSLEEILRGGSLDSKRVRNFRRYRDGTWLDGNEGDGAYGWDGLLVKYRFGNRELNVGYLGVMEQPYRLLGAAARGITSRKPTVHEYNYTRTRHAFDIQYDHAGNEIWTDHGSVSEATPGTDGAWISAGHAHGYGGRPLMDENGFAVQYDGSYWMIFERVTEQRAETGADGRVNYLPWVTQEVARRMADPYRFYRKGERLSDGRPADEEILIAGISPAPTQLSPHPTPFPSSDRRGLGYLVEGFNLMASPQKIGNQYFWIGFTSANNYVNKDYGVQLWFREYGAGPIGRYTPATDASGDLANWVHDFSERRHYTWVGRADGFSSGGNGLWLIAHGVDESTLPMSFPRSGWPSPEQAPYYARSQLLLPFHFTVKNNMPGLQIED